MPGPVERKEPTVTVRVPVSIKEQLEHLARILNMNIPDVVRLIFDSSQSPLTFLMLLFDMRQDVKTFLQKMDELIRTLNTLAEELKQWRPIVEKLTPMLERLFDTTEQ